MCQNCSLPLFATSFLPPIVLIDLVTRRTCSENADSLSRASTCQEPQTTSALLQSLLDVQKTCFLCMPHMQFWQKHDFADRLTFCCSHQNNVWGMDGSPVISHLHTFCRTSLNRRMKKEKERENTFVVTSVTGRRKKKIWCLIQRNVPLVHARACVQHGLSYTLKFKCMPKCYVPWGFGKHVSN